MKLSLKFIIFAIATFITSSVFWGHQSNAPFQLETETEVTKLTEATHHVLSDEPYMPLYEDDFDLKRNMYVNYSDKILDGYLVVHGNFQNDVRFDVDHIDWDITATLSPNTFSLYLHTLRPVFYLSASYLITGDQEYLDIAEKMILSWDEYDRSHSTKNRYTWYDHSVAERTENLILFVNVNKQLDVNKRGKFDQIIRKNAEWLYDDRNYTRNHNHGIFQDGALLKAGYYLKQQEYIDKALNRLDEQLKFAFPNKYVHVENSIGYHLGIISYLKRITDFLKHHDNEYYKTSEEYLNGALDYIVYSMKPNRGLPYIGDTVGASKSSISLSDYGNSTLRYVLSEGKDGERPEFLTRFYKDDGYIIFREHWNPENYKDASWLLFKSGYSSSTHKHADDLSFVFYSKGKDIFIDPGMYNYMVGDPIHDYMNSVYAHNTLVVDGKSYSIGMFNSRKVGIYGYQKKEDYEVVTGYNNIYPGVNIDRSIYYLSGDHFFIVDDIVSDDNHDYTQIFHLSRDVSIREANEKEVVLDITGTGYVVLLQQLANIDSLSVITGNHDNGKMSYISVGMNQVTSSTTMQFHQNNVSSTRFITSIRIVKSDELELYRKTKTPIIENNSIKIEDIILPVNSRGRLPNSHISAAFEGNKLRLTNTAASSEPLSYSFYLLDKETGRKYSSVSYSNNNTAEFILEESGSYALITYLRNNSKETNKKLTGYIEKNAEGQYVFSELPLEEQEPKFIGHTMERVSDNKFKFRVDIENINKINAKWYVYKNGASYDFIGNSELELEYEFREPGLYTVIYRIGDVYFGEIEYNHFNQIKIE